MRTKFDAKAFVEANDRIGKAFASAGPLRRLTVTVPLTVRAPSAVRREAASGSVWKAVLLLKVMDFAVLRPTRLAPATTVRSELLMEPVRFRVPTVTVVGPE